MSHLRPAPTPLIADDAAEWSLTGEYSALWNAQSGAPDLFEFLRTHPNLDPDQRTRLVLWDQARSWAGSVGRSVEDYLRGDPSLETDPELLVKLVVREFHLQDPSPPITEFVDRFPKLKPQLLEQLCGLDEDSSFIQRPELDADSDSSLNEEATSSLNAASAAPETGHEPTARVDPEDSERLDPETLAGDERVSGEATSFAAGSLRNCFPFQSLPGALVEELQGHMVEQTYAPNELLIRQGDPGNSLILLREGTVNIVVKDELGVAHEIDRSGPGDILGEMALLTEEPRSASVVAREAVKVLLLPADTFHEYAQRHPQISQVLTQLLAQRLGGSRRDVLLGKTLDQYLIVRRLGRGGMSIVYEGRDQRDESRVALKMLSHRLVYDQSSLAWFQREADLIESFDHPNIVRMFGRLRAFQSYFIVMQFCDGITFERLVRINGPMSLDNFKKAFGQLASAVWYAHQRGVIHRDIKPVNLMLNFDGQVKLMDFGLARPLHTQPDDAMSEHIVGTPRYMAPEQLKGRELTEAADYFALGCTAYKLLTGTALFTEPDVNKLRSLHARWTVPDFSQLRPNMPDEFVDLLTGCLQRRPDQRSCDLANYATWAAPLDVTRLL